MTKRTKAAPRGSAGTRLRADHKDGPQRIRSDGRRWTEQSEAIFLDCLAASCNITWSAAQAGFTEMTAYYHRRRDPGFADRWQSALDHGYVRLEAALLKSATDYVEHGQASSPIRDMTVKEALHVMSLHRATVRGPGGREAGWRSPPRSLDQMRDSILLKLEAIEALRRREEARSRATPSPKESASGSESGTGPA